MRNASRLLPVLPAARSARRNNVALTGVAALAAVGLLAASVSASTIELSSGESTGGLDLTASNVLVATTAIGGSSAMVQGVTFAVPTGTATLASSTAHGVTVTIAAPTQYSDSGMTYPDNTIHQPDDNALKTVMNVISGNYNGPILVSVTGLADNTQYAVDVLQSSVGYGGRSQTVSFSDSTKTENVDLDASDGFNTHDVLTSDGSGNLTVTVENVINSGNAGVLNGFVISSAVPEPASLGLLGVAGFGLLMRRRRAAGA